MRLVIAEKPSVAQSIGAVLGANSRKAGYMEGSGYIVTWCVGHLVGLAPADYYEELTEKISEGLKTIKANGTYDKIYQKWFGKQE